MIESLEHRAVALILAEVSLDPVRQQRIAWEHAVESRLALVALAPDPAAVVAMVTGREVDTVLVALAPAGDPLAEYERAVIAAGGWWLYVRRVHRPPASAVDTARAELVRTALARSGGDVVLVANLLGLDVAEVAALVDPSFPARADTSRPVPRLRPTG